MAKKIILTGEVKVTDKGLEETSKKARTLDRNLKGAAQTSSSSTKNFSKMSQGITGGLVPAYAVLAANIFAIGAAFRFLTEQANMALLIEAQESFAASTGIALQSITVRLREASGGMLGFKEAAQAAAIGMAKGFSVKQLTDLAEGAKKVSAALGRTFEDAFDRLLKGTSKAEPELLDELGITLRLEEATKRYGDAINKNHKELTIWERSQAVLIETQRQLNEQFGGIEVAVNPFVRLSATFEDIVRNVSQFLLPIFSGLASIISSSGLAAVAVFGALGLSILRSAIPMDTLKTKIKEFADKHSQGFKDAKDDLKQYRVELDKTKQTLEQAKAAAMGDLKGQAGMAVFGGSKSKILKKVAMGGALTGTDKANLDKALRSAEQQWAQHGEIRNGIFKGANIELVNDTRVSLNQITASSVQMGAKVGGVWTRMRLRSKVAFSAIKAGGVATFNAIGKSAMFMGKMVGKAMKLAGVIGMIIMAWELFQKLWANVYDMSMGILKFTDKVINAVTGGVRTAIASVIEFFADAIDTVFGSFYTALGELIKSIGVEVAKLPDFGTGVAEKAGKALQSVGEGITGKKGPEFVKGMRATAASIRDVGDSASDLAGTFAESDLGKMVKGWQDVRREGAKTEEMFSNLADRIKAFEADTEALVGDVHGAGGVGTGFMKKGLTDLQRSAMQMQAITSLDVAGLLGEAMKVDARGGDVDAEMRRIREAIQPLVAHVPQLAKLMPILNQPLSVDMIESFWNLGVIAQKSTAATAGFTNSLETLRKASSGITSASGLYDYLELLKTSKDLATEAHGSAAEADGIVNAYEQLNQTIGGNADKVIATLQAIRNENEAIKKSKLDLALADTEAAQKGALLAKLAKEKNKIDKLALDQQKRRNDLEALYNINKENMDSKALATHNERIAYMEHEIMIREKQMILEERAVSDLGKITKTVADSFQNGMVTAFDAIIQGTKDVKEAFLNMADGILKALANIINQMIAAQIAQGLSSLFGGMMGMGQGAGAGAGSGRPAASEVTVWGGEKASFPWSRYGGVVKPPPHLAAGGVASGRQAGYPAILHGTEAVVPLPQGNSIPVDLKGAGGDQNVVVNVNVASDGSVTQQTEETTGQEALQMGKLVSIAVTRELQKQKRQGGMLSPHGIA